jgi:hypothetical protein
LNDEHVKSTFANDSDDSATFGRRYDFYPRGRRKEQKFSAARGPRGDDTRCATRPERNMSNENDQRSKFDFKDFGINEGAIFDLIYPDPYPIGLNRSYPKEFIERVVFASLSYKLQNKSIDYTRRAYRDGFEIEQKPRIRSSIEDMLDRSTRVFDDFIEGHREAAIGDNHAGLVLFDVYVFRALDSIQAAAILSTHGFFGETISTLRYFIEQVCWLTAIVDCADAGKIVETRAESSFGNAKKIFPRIGELYGFFSETAHFRPSHHSLHLSTSDGRVAALRRSARFSAAGFCAMTVCLGYLLKMIIGMINCQYPYEKSKIDSKMIDQYHSILDYFGSAKQSEFIVRLLAASELVDLNFAPWPKPIFKIA